MFPSDEMLMKMYELCDKDDDCERGSHTGPCGLCICESKHQGSCSTVRS